VVLCQACVRRCVAVMATTVPVCVSVTPAGRVVSVTCLSRTVRSRRAVAMAGVLTALASVLPDSRATAANTVSIHLGEARLSFCLLRVVISAFYVYFHLCVCFCFIVLCLCLYLSADVSGFLFSACFVNFFYYSLHV